MLECRYEQVKTTQILREDQETVKIEGELFLPEDVLELQNIYSSQGYLGEVRGEIDGRNLSLYGQVEAHLTYAGITGEEERSEFGYAWRGENAINFAERIPLPDLPDTKVAEWDWDTELGPLSLEILSGRRLKYQAELGVKVRAREERMITVINNIETEAQIETVNERVMLDELVAVAKGSRELNNQYQLSYPKAPVARIIGSNAKPVGVKVTVSKGRITIEGILEMTLVYVSLGQEGEEAGIEAVDWNQKNGGALPFQIVLEEPNAAPEQVALSKVWLESLNFSSPHPEVCRVQAVLGARAELVNPHQLQAVFEVTAEEENILDILRQDYEMEEIVGEVEKVLQIEKSLTLPTEKVNIEEVLLVDASRPRIVECQADLERIFVEGEVDFSLLYLGEGETETVLTSAAWGSRDHEKIVFGEFIEIPGVEEGMSASVNLIENDIRVEVLDERSIQVTIEYRARIIARAKRSFSLIRDCALIVEDERTRPSMLFYLVQKGDNLWKVARHYNTTMNAIASVNNLSETEDLSEGLKLLIPKR